MPRSRTSDAAALIGALGGKAGTKKQTDARRKSLAKNRAKRWPKKSVDDRERTL